MKIGEMLTDKTPQAAFGVGGATLKCYQPYEGGHECNDLEAGVLNQTLIENVRNNKRKEIEELVEKKATPAEMQKVIDEYLKGYEFGVRQGGFRTQDPVMAEAMRDARERILAAYRKKGVKTADISSKDVTEKARLLIEKNQKLLERAKKVIADREKELDEIVADL